MESYQSQNGGESEDHDQNPTSVIHCWWRKSTNFMIEEAMPNLSRITPKIKLLREMERLALVAADGLDELRHKLFMYSAGDFWVPIGGINKEDMDIPPVNTILLVGFHNAGKSSLVNLMYSVLGRSGLVPFAQTSSGSASSYSTLFMEEHNVLRSARNGFCVYDTRGFDYDRVAENLEELSGWITDGVEHNQLCLRPGDDLQYNNELETSRSSLVFATRTVNSVMVVANVAEIYKAVKAGDKKPLEAFKHLFYCPALRKSNENPILILTHGDKLSAEDRIDARLKICEHVGVSEASGTYDIVCVTEYGFLADEFDPISAYSVAEAVYRALLISDKGHVPKKKFSDWALMALSWLMCCLSSLFAFLAHIFSRLGRRN